MLNGKPDCTYTLSAVQHQLRCTQENLIRTLTTVPLAPSDTRRLLPASPPADLTNRARSRFTALVSSSSMARLLPRLSYWRASRLPFVQRSGLVAAAKTDGMATVARRTLSSVPLPSVCAVATLWALRQARRADKFPALYTVVCWSQLSDVSCTGC